MAFSVFLFPLSNPQVTPLPPLKGLTFLNMDLQKATLGKRIGAWLLDLFLLAFLAAGASFLISTFLNYETYTDTMETAYAHYEQEYGVTFQMSAAEYSEMSDAQKQEYEIAYNALLADEEAMYAYDMMINIALVVTTSGLLLAVLILEFLVPLLRGDGQTIGKKAFNLGVVRTDSVRISGVQLFIRSILGKYTIELMLPILLVLAILWGVLDITGTLILIAIGLVQIILYCVTKNNAQIHDLLAGTVVIDIYSQRIFSNKEDMLAYVKQQEEERAQKRNYY